MAANAAVRGILAIVAGVIAGGMVIGVTEMAGHTLFPLPTGLDIRDPAQLARMWEVMPAQSKAMVPIAWFLGALAGASLAIGIARRVLPAWIVGVAIAGLGLWTTQQYPHPDWMMASAVVLPLVAVLAAKRLMAGRLVTGTTAA